MNKELLIISELYYPEETSTGYFITGIAEGIARNPGFNVRVLTSQPTYSQRGLFAPENEVRNKVFIRRISAPSGNKNKLIGRLWNMLSLTIRMGLRMLLQVKKNDSVIVVTNPPSLPTLAAWICKIKSAQAILLVQDIYPDVLVPTGLMDKDSFLYKAVNAIQKNMLYRMKKILVLGRDMEQLIRSKDSFSRLDIEIIPNWGDIDTVYPELRNKNFIRKKHHLDEKFIVQFSGNLGRTHGIEDLVELVRCLRKYDEIHLLVFGWGAGRDFLINSMDTYQLRNITVLDPCPREELGLYLTACDLFFLPFKKGMEGISVPSRIYNVMAAGNAILAIAGSESELAYIVKEEEIGFVVEPGDIDGIKEKILYAMDNRDELDQMRKRARNAVEKKYTKKIVINKYVSLLRAMDN